MRLTTMLLTCTMTAMTITGTASLPVEGGWKPQRKKLLDISWSNPTVDQLTTQLEQMEQDAPMDGITLFLEGKMTVDGNTKSVYSNHAMTKLKWEYGYFADSVEKLKKLKFKKFTDNFLYTVMVPADVNWFSDSDWEAVCNNYGIISRITREAGLKGIVFDPEEYAGDLWGNYKGHSHADAVKMARQRGREFGTAVFKENPKIKILCLFLFSFGTYLQGDAMYSTLSHSFFNGIYDVMPPEATMIEGHEYFGYFAKSRNDYRQLQQDLDRTFLPRVATVNVAKYRTQTQLSAPIYLDSYFYKTNPCYKYLLPEIEQVPKLEFLRRNLTHAVDVSDEYVWFYSENCSFWTKSRHPKVKQTWEEKIPGINDTIRRVVDPFTFRSAGPNLLQLPELDKEPGNWLFWTSEKSDGTGNWKDGLIYLTGVRKSGCVHQSVSIIPGHEYLLLVEARPRSSSISGSLSLHVAFRDKTLKWLPHQTERTAYSGQKKHGPWERIALKVTAPPNAFLLSFQLGSKKLKQNETVEFRRPELIDLSEVPEKQEN